MTASKIFFYFCLAFAAGIFADSLIKIPQLIMLGFLIFGLVLVAILRKHKNAPALGFCVLFLVLGIWRHQTAQMGDIKSGILEYNDKSEFVTLTGIIDDEPDIKAGSKKLKIKNEKLEINGQSIDVGGRVLVTMSRYPEYKYGDELRITGRLKSPQEDIEGFNYREYLKKDGIYSVMDWPKVELVSRGKGSVLYEHIFAFKNKIKTSINRVMSPPQSGLLEALFFGDEGNISQEWKDKFSITGTSHITAVSGMNITIISALILNFLLAIGFWRGQAFYISVVLIVLYILMIGAPASAIRAGIMGILFMAAQNFGRAGAASRAVAFASTLMLFQNPLLLRADLGFQLSFMAVLGLIYLQPVLSQIFKKIPDFFQLRYSLSATIAAQIFTLPILISSFGRLSLASPFANILIVPTLSFITILGFIFSFSGMIFYPLGLVLSWPVWLLLTYVLGVINFFSKISFATIKLENVGWIWAAIFYAILAISVRQLIKRMAQPEFLK